MYQKNNQDNKYEVHPKQRRTFNNMIYRSLGKFIRNRRIPGINIDWKHNNNNQSGKEEENSRATALNKEKLRRIGTAMKRNLSASGVPNREKLGGDGGWTRNAAVIAAKLHEDEDQ